jgi:hypothetical protein
MLFRFPVLVDRLGALRLAGGLSAGVFSSDSASRRISLAVSLILFVGDWRTLDSAICFDAADEYFWMLGSVGYLAMTVESSASPLRLTTRAAARRPLAAKLQNTATKHSLVRGQTTDRSGEDRTT